MQSKGMHSESRNVFLDQKKLNFMFQIRLARIKQSAFSIVKCLQFVYSLEGVSHTFPI